MCSRALRDQVPPCGMTEQALASRRRRPNILCDNVEPACATKAKWGSAMNYLRTAILLAGLTALFMGVGYLIGGQTGAMIALVVAAAMNLFSYWNSDRMVLSMHGAQEVDDTTAPDLVNLVAGLAERA